MATHTLKLDLVSEMVDNYRNHQLKSIINSTTSPMVFDAHSVWFTLETLKDFITTIEEEVAKNSEFPTKNLGVRFYYAAYPEKNNYSVELNTIPAEYEKLHTVIALPTTEIDGANYDFDPFNTNTYNGTKPTGTGLSIMAENHGGLTPPTNVKGEWF